VEGKATAEKEREEKVKEATVSVICPVCKKVKKNPVDCARHMFGTGDKPHRAWFETQGLSFIDLLLDQATQPGNKSYELVGGYVEKAQKDIK
jgi:hypothetical protein